MAAKGNMTDIQDVQANECAQALLELAMSFSPAVKPQEMPSVHASIPVKRSLPRTKMSSPKRRRTTSTISPPHNFKPNCVMKRKGVSRVQIYNELVAGIHLDHCYSMSAEANDEQTASAAAADENIQHNVPASRQPVSLLSTPRQDKQPTGYLQQQQQQQPDLFKADDSNYENFNLLLKCLKNVEEPYIEQKNHANGIGNSNASNRKDGNANDLSASSEEGPSKGESPLFSCKDCSKQFTKKRYLIKHAQRMHPSNVLGTAMCRNCEQPQADLSSHVCPRGLAHTDLANCHFCGLRLRKNVLEKHLVQEHGMERRSASDEGGSSTISGSEHEQVTSAAAGAASTEAVCGICHLVVRSLSLEQHVYEHISANQVQNCPVCNVPYPEQHLLVDHVVSCHCVTPPPLPRRAEDRAAAACKHSMLQRFLRDSRNGGQSAGGGIMDGGEQCAACMGSLVTSMASSSHTLQCSMSASNLLERTATELIEALQCAGK